MKIMFRKAALVVLLAFCITLAGPLVLELAFKSDPANVIKAAYPPAVPTLASPTDNAEVIGDTATFQWNASEGATEYQLEILRADNTVFLLTEAIYSATSFEVTGLPADGTGFKWRVRAGNVSIWSDWSAFNNFTNTAEDEEETNPDPRYIYYQNDDLVFVRIDYQKLVDDLFNNDSRLRNAARIALTNALFNIRSVIIADADRVIDYGEAVKYGKSYSEAFADPAYLTTAPTPVKELIINQLTGEAEEVDL